MRTSRRIFYVVYFQDQLLQHTLDAMRFIADPKEKFSAHITIRGPYLQKYHFRRMDRRIHGAQVMADGVGSFFGEDQNTVFIRCRSEILRYVWKKSDYEYNPHITLYDGSSRNFARMLLDRLDHLPLRFSFVVGKLSPLVSMKKQYSMELSHAVNEDMFFDVVGRYLGASEVHRLSVEERIGLIESFARKLPDFTSISDSRSGTVRAGAENST